MPPSGADPIPGVLFPHGFRRCGRQKRYVICLISSGCGPWLLALDARRAAFSDSERGCSRFPELDGGLSSAGECFPETRTDLVAFPGLQQFRGGR